MSVLSTVGRRSPGMRALIALLYAMLITGAVTMVYPFLLMLSTSVCSGVDVTEYRIVPRYLNDDGVLFAKYAEEKYGRPDVLNATYGTEFITFTDLIKHLPGRLKELEALPAAAREARLKDWQSFAATLPLAYKSVTFLSIPGLTGRSHALYRDFVQKKFDNDLPRCKETYQEDVLRFQAIDLPFERLLNRDYVPEPSAKYLDFLVCKQSLPADYLCVVSADAGYAEFLRRRYDGSLEKFNADFGAAYKSFSEIHLSERVPEGKQKERAAWADFVRGKLTLSFIGVYDGVARFNAFLSHVRPRALLREDDWDRHVRPGIDRPRLLAMAEAAPLFYDFLKTEDPSNLRVLTAENLYRAALRQQYGSIDKLNAAYGSAHADWQAISPPVLEADWQTLHGKRAESRRHYLTRNFAEVLDYILLHGRAVWNTAVLIVLTMLTSLTVNPLAAYALSRFQLSYTNKVLLFCLATMAFPPEVGMIPSFLMLRSFPLAKLVVGVAMGVLIFGVYALIARGRVPLWIGAALGLAFGVAAAQTVSGGEVPLLNSYSALILPGIANGFSIFLFKGFFDTLPKELYEAASMEGAGEVRMFWQITLPLCAPVIAVIGLSTFTAAYGSFMWAFLVCQKEDMWTLMVWLYEMQQWAPSYVLTAALTLAAIPTLLAILLCQRVILRGMILPSLH